MKRITRDIDPSDARDLLERVPRACVGFAGDDGPIAEPVTFALIKERYLTGFTAEASQHPVAGEEVVLLLDEGLHFFDLRAIYIRGRAEPIDAPEGGPDRCAWFAVEPTKMVAWDYGRMRNAEDES